MSSSALPKTSQLALATADWPTINRRLYAHALQVAENFKWAGQRYRHLAKGKTLEDVVYGAVEAVLAGC